MCRVMLEEPTSCVFLDKIIEILKKPQPEKVVLIENPPVYEEKVEIKQPVIEKQIDEDTRWPIDEGSSESEE